MKCVEEIYEWGHNLGYLDLDSCQNYWTEIHVNGELSQNGLLLTMKKWRKLHGHQRNSIQFDLLTCYMEDLQNVLYGASLQ